MSNPNIKPSDRAVFIGEVAPISASTAKSTGYIPMGPQPGGFDSIQAIVQAGVTASGGTVDAKLEQADTSTGGNLKDITGKAITQLTAVNGNAGPRNVILNCRSDELDVNAGFCYVRLTITPATAASLISGAILGHDARFQPADDLSTVAQVVG